MSYWTPVENRSEGENKFESSYFKDKKKKRREKDENLSDGKLSLAYLRKRGFQEALGGKSLEDLIESNNKFFDQYNERRSSIAEEKIKPIDENLTVLKSEIEKFRKDLEEIETVKKNIVTERDKFQEQRIKLEKDFLELTHQLSEAEKALVKNRFSEVKEKLNDLVALYNDIFEEKLGNEQDLRTAVGDHRKVCTELIKDSKESLESVNGALNRIYKFGSSRESARFLIFAGLVSTMTAGWFFTSFSSSNDIVSQNWLFFSLNNLFNYLSLYISQYTPFFAASYMIGYFVVILVMISGLVFIADFVLDKLSNDHPDLQLGVQLSKRKKGFFKFKINTNSSLSFWLQVLPWVFVLGLLMILVAVGQYNAGDEDQISTFSRKLSGQVMGLTFTLLCAGVFFLYLTKVIEPRKMKAEEKEDSDKISTSSKKTGRNSNIELIIVVIATNAFLLILVLSQIMDGFALSRNVVLSLICFMITTNLAAYVLAYGIRQKGLFGNKNILERRIFYLNKLLTALSGSKPINIWIAEERQFQKHFLKIQRELFNIIHAKNKVLNYVPRSQLNKANNIKTHFHFLGIKLWKRANMNWYNPNFPELSESIRLKKMDMEETRIRLKTLNEKVFSFVEKQSDFEKGLNESLDNLEKSRQDLINEKASVQITMREEIENAERNRVLCAQEFMEGHNLGMWAKENLNPTNKKVK